MNLKKYFKGKYRIGVCDCWTLICDIYKDDHNLELPLVPYTRNTSEDFKDFIVNMVLEKVIVPEKGVILYTRELAEHHAGYCIDSEYYIHRSRDGVRVEKIPSKDIELFKVKEVINV